MFDLQNDQPVGKILINQNQYGIVFTPNLVGLPPGLHGFHIHENPSCESRIKEGKTILGGAAGGHYDPDKTGQHGYPWSNNNHKGDLPALYANTTGQVTQPILAPRLTIEELKNRSIMVHAGGDNHSDHPKLLGGGGARIVCGVIQ
ncbi:superoxide dismutase family protein [Marinicella sp. W31]|uniref:superoxide dismutase family protein n=1 Tax=Marinicella sp. W31 TaxID=3023713 RepID=UPI003756AF2A